MQFFSILETNTRGVTTYELQGTNEVKRKIGN